MHDNRSAPPAGRATLPRDPLSRETLVNLTRAARLLGMRDADARRWLRRHGLILSLDGRPRVRWGAVLDVLEGNAVPPVADPPRRTSLPRSGLLGGGK